MGQLYQVTCCVHGPVISVDWSCVHVPLLSGDFSNVHAPVISGDLNCDIS